MDCIALASGDGIFQPVTSSMFLLSIWMLNMDRYTLLSASTSSWLSWKHQDSRLKGWS